MSSSSSASLSLSLSHSASSSAASAASSSSLSSSAAKRKSKRSKGGKSRSGSAQAGGRPAAKPVSWVPKAKDVQIKAEGRIVLYPKPDYKGRPVFLSRAGKFPLSHKSLRSLGNKVGSVTVPPGYKVTVRRDQTAHSRKVICFRDNPDIHLDTVAVVEITRKVLLKRPMYRRARLERKEPLFHKNSSADSDASGSDESGSEESGDDSSDGSGSSSASGSSGADSDSDSDASESDESGDSESS